MSTGAKGKRKTRQGKWKRVIRFGKEGEGGDCVQRRLTWVRVY